MQAVCTSKLLDAAAMNSLTHNITTVIGLGNPGVKYAHNRHNIGFLVVDALCERHGGVWKKTDIMETACVMINDKKVLLIKPQTFMNAAGNIIPALRKQGITTENILAVHDELELPFGTIKTKIGGSAKGHNGLRSIIQACGFEFARLRCGIGRPEDKNQVPDYVLQNFSEPSADVTHMIDTAADTAQAAILSGL